MSKDAGKVSCVSLSPADKDGWLTKQGGSYKNWKRRWFILKGENIYYFKTKKDSDMTGVIPLTKESFVKRDPTSKKKNCFAVGTVKRVYFMFPDPDRPGDTEEWIQKIQSVIQSIIPCTPIVSISDNPQIKAIPGNQQPLEINTTLTPVPLSKEPDISPTVNGVREQTRSAKDCISFLQSDGQMVEFWDLWMESLPPTKVLKEGSISFQVATSASMDRVTWRCFGPQEIFIQEMVDFFWNVGSPETEIDRLNDVGALVNPSSIGSWIDMSEKGGMDGGWFFPIEVPTKLSWDAADEGESLTKLAEWAKKHGIDRCDYLGRDMGAAPPRQTEVRFQPQGETFGEQVAQALSAYTEFGISPPPVDIINLIQCFIICDNIL
eukprot:TRINITY_DN1524_c0_g1_i8.p1 TRINITY_DN1524_c0_g1~~TRINITY_DN1524_c0_g1_i8.p1  ORF type:complete len:378 (-),score=76.50 TRINITY_DN1524_c0_g1_i8:842-1975(-)